MRLRMSHKLNRALLPLLLGMSVTFANESRAEDFSHFVDKLRLDATAAGISRAVIREGTRGLTPNRKVMSLSKKQPEFLQPVGRYISKRVTKGAIHAGRRKVRKHAWLLEQVEERYGVDRFVVAAIWGLETSYGGYTGKSDVMRSLATLGWSGYRGDFFRKQFLDALYIMQTEKIGRDRMVGSWAGGLGQTQFIPSSYRAHAVDFDGDGRRDLWRSTADALASTANYLVKHGWAPHQPWGFAVSLPSKLPRTAETRQWRAWRSAGVRRRDGGRLPAKGSATLFFPAGSEGPAFLVTGNYWAIRDYNWSDSYVLSVTQLARHFGKRQPVSLDWPRTRPLLKPQRQRIQALLAKLGYKVPNRIGRITADMRDVIRDYQLSRGLVADGHPDEGLLAALERE